MGLALERGLEENNENQRDYFKNRKHKEEEEHEEEEGTYLHTLQLINLIMDVLFLKYFIIIFSSILIRLLF